MPALWFALGVLAAILVLAICQRRRRLAVSGQILFGPAGENPMSKAVVHADDTSITGTLVIKDKKGNVVTPKTPPVWSMADSSVATMAVSDDGQTGTFTNFAVGDSTIDVVVDGADMEDGNPAHFSGEIQVLAAGGVTGDVTFGAAT